MLVGTDELRLKLKLLATKEFLSLDTETTGLRPYHGDRLLGIVLADERDELYFDVSDSPYRPGETRLEGMGRLRHLLSVPTITWFLHNAKFDMHMLAQAGLFIKGTIWCTMAAARVEYNDHLSYSLNACAGRIGLAKDDRVMDYLKEHKLYEKRKIPGKKKLDTHYFFNRVPKQLLQEYAEQDARVTFALGTHQAGMDEHFDTLLVNERALTKVCFDMERVGVRIDPEYCSKAAPFETNRALKAAEDFQALSGVEFRGSAKCFTGVFNSMGIPLPTKKTKGGNISFDKEALEYHDQPIVQHIKDYRDAYSRAGFHHGFLYHRDHNDDIHSDMKQGGTRFGRFSNSDPNLQNLSKKADKGKKRKVRGAVVPREGYCLVMLDYDQMEYSLMLDYAGEMGVIRKVLAGMDVHNATAEEMSIEDRDTAKQTNFMLLYGGRAAKLAAALKIPLAQAKELFSRYFHALPYVDALIDRIITTAKTRGWVRNWFGRKSHFPNRNHAYKAPNSLMQGGCADIMKIAMVQIHALLEGYKSRMIIQVHDELVLEMHRDELPLVAGIKKIMETVYPHKHLPLTVGVEHSWKSWADKVEGVPKNEPSTNQSETLRH